MCGNEPCRHDRADAITSLVASANATAKALAERDAALATLAKVAAIVADPDAALVVDRIREVLETQPERKATK